MGEHEYALVDDELYPFLSRYTWFAHRGGDSKNVYAVVWLWVSEKDERRKMFYMHRFIMNASPTRVVDHKNGHTTDNQEDNLRLMTKRENSRNIHKSKFKGCYYDPRYNTWWCRVIKDHKAISLGVYDTELECALAYNHGALAAFGDDIHESAFNKIPNWRNIIPKPHVKQHRHHQANNKSGIPGVHQHKTTHKWLANITVSKKQIYLGVFKDKFPAVQARYEAELKYFGTSAIDLKKFKAESLVK